MVVCARTVVADSLKEEFRSLIQHPLDWDYVVGISARNSVLQLVSRNLLDCEESELPEIAGDQLRGELSAIQSRNMFLTAEMLRIVGLLEENGIEVLPFKGPMLALQAYGNPCLRYYSDLDILVPPGKFNSAVRILQLSGFSSLTSASWLDKTNWYVSPKKDIYLVNEDRSVTLELHWKLSGSHFGMGRMSGLWGQLETVELAGRPVKTLPFCDNLIYLCMHGSRHSWERLQWICDVHELVRSQSTIDWLSIHDEAKHLGCEKVVTLGLLLVYRYFGLEVPAPFLPGLRENNGLEKMAEDIDVRLFSRNPNWADFHERYHYHLGLRERGVDRWKLRYNHFTRYVRLALTPSEKDEEWLPGANWLAPVRFLLRPFRLLYRRFRGTE